MYHALRKTFVVVSCVLSFSYAVTAVAATTAPLNTAQVFTKSYAALGKPKTVTVEVRFEKTGQTQPLRLQAKMTSNEWLALFKRIRANAAFTASPSSLPQLELSSGPYEWTKFISVAATRNILSSMLPVVKKTKMDKTTLRTLTAPIKNFKAGVINVRIDRTTFYPDTVTLRWQTVTKVKNQQTSTGFGLVIRVLPEAQSSVPVTSDTNKRSAVILDVPVSSTPGRAMDAGGNGGVVVPEATGDMKVTATRDAKRLSDLKQLQTALELYYYDQDSYPTGSNITLGSGAASCLNSDGWTAADNCPYPYMGYVPSDPWNGNAPYVYTGGGNNYKISARLEGTSSGLSGAIYLMPNGIYKQ